MIRGRVRVRAEREGRKEAEEMTRNVEKRKWAREIKD
jgi:hypothetical protein